MDHYGQTYRTRALPSETDVFIGPRFNLYRHFDLESVWVVLEKEADAPYMLLTVDTTLSNGGGHPFQEAQANGKALDFTHLALSTHDAINLDLTSLKMTVEKFTLRIPVSLASSAACDSKDFVIQLAGQDKEPLDLKLPRAMLQGFLGKVKKSGEEGIEGKCFDQFG